jgi:transposase-like protein
LHPLKDMKLNEDRATKVVEMIKGGCPRLFAARAAGVVERTLHYWLRKGRDERKRRDDGDEPNADLDMFVRLVDDVELAEATCVSKAVGMVTAAAESGVWSAAAWWLERRWPEEFGANRAEIVRELRELRKALRDKGD